MSKDSSCVTFANILFGKEVTAANTKWRHGEEHMASSGHILQCSIAKYMDSLMGEVFEPFFFCFCFCNPSTVFFKYKELTSGGLSIKNIF